MQANFWLLINLQGCTQIRKLHARSVFLPALSHPTDPPIVRNAAALCLQGRQDMVSLRRPRQAQCSSPQTLQPGASTFPQLTGCSRWTALKTSPPTFTGLAGQQDTSQVLLSLLISTTCAPTFPAAPQCYSEECMHTFLPAQC